MNDEIVTNFLGLVSPLQDHIKELYLFGSRCRDDWRPDSDYDILLILHKKDREIVSRLYDAVVEVLLTTGKLISLKIFSLEEFNRLKSLPTPFIENVMTEGMKLGIRG
ncbi:MAG: nucleotidyltransferase domain-containing protein [Candidatus Latescibacteria bacterium]|nr:nucleotidyltransferase domain-containing protein [Candidatus Latescibacterota bacterium]